MSEYLLAGLLFVVLHISSNRFNRRLQEDEKATQRRIGWGYGYGAGYSDATAHRKYDLTPPTDGYARHPRT